MYSDDDDYYHASGDVLQPGQMDPRDELQELRKIVQGMREQPTYIGVALRRDPKDTAQYFINGPRGQVRSKWGGRRLHGGQAVILNDKMKILEATDHYMVGPIGSVDGLLGDSMAEVGVKGEKRLVYFEDELKIQLGDRVALDRNVSVVIRNLGKEKPTYTSAFEPLGWDEIGGHELAKKELQSAIELPAKHPELFRRYGDVAPKGILMYGPPGCGKTLLGRGGATSQGKMHGAKTNEGFFYLKGPEVLDKYIGNAEGSIRQIFAYAREHKSRHGYPAIIFLDEAEALLAERGSRKSSDVDSTIIPTFLSEMDGFDPSSALIILATNLPDTLDPAVTREGRVDRKVYVGPPDKNTAKEIAAIHLDRVPVAGKREVITDAIVEGIWSPERALYEVFTNADGNGADKAPICLSDVVNGALVAGVVKRAAMGAIRREVAGDKTAGIGADDVNAALDSVYEENRRSHHREFVAQIARDRGATSVVRLFDGKQVWGKRAV